MSRSFGPDIWRGTRCCLITSSVTPLRVMIAVQDPLTRVSELLSLRTIRLIKLLGVCVGGRRGGGWGTADSWMSFLRSHRLCGPLGRRPRRVVVTSRSVLAELPRRQPSRKRGCQIVPMQSRTRCTHQIFFTRKHLSFSLEKKIISSRLMMLMRLVSCSCSGAIAVRKPFETNSLKTHKKTQTRAVE